VVTSSINSPAASYKRRSFVSGFASAGINHCARQ
jgi:hypothetical protein